MPSLKCVGVSLRCSLTVQTPRLCKVLRAAVAIVVHEAEATLRVGVSLRRSLTVQTPRLCKV